MRLIDADAFKAHMKDALEQTRNAYTDGGEWAQTITEQFCEAIDEQPTIDALTAQEKSQEVSNNSPELDKENGELISRQDAINLIERYCDNGCEIAEDKWCPDCQQSKFAEMIKALPSSPSRPKGHWEMVSQHGTPPTYIYNCSECRHKSFGFYNYCPNCGADMRT